MKLAIVGCGGFGRQVAAMLEFTCTSAWMKGLQFVTEDTVYPRQVLGIPVMHASQWLEEVRTNSDEEYKHIIAIQKSVARERLDKVFMENGSNPFSLIHPQIINYGHNIIADGAVIAEFVSLHPDIRIGRGFHCNSFSYIGHDCVIGDYVTFNYQIGVSGNVRIGDHAFIGTGAKIRQGIRIGKYATVGMGAIVVKDVADYETVIGNPARPLTQKNSERNTS